MCKTPGMRIQRPPVLSVQNRAHALLSCQKYFVVSKICDGREEIAKIIVRLTKQEARRRLVIRNW